MLPAMSLVAQPRSPAAYVLAVAIVSACADDGTVATGSESSSDSSSSTAADTTAAIDSMGSSAGTTTMASADTGTSSTDAGTSGGATGETSMGETSGGSSSGSTGMGGEGSSDTGLNTSCPIGELDVVPMTEFGNTFGQLDDFSGSCGGDVGPDAEYTFVAPTDGVYTFDTQGSQLNTVLYLLDGTCGGTELGCNDDGDGPQSALTATLTAGQAITVVVDSASAAGAPFNLRVRAGAFSCPILDLGSTNPQTVQGSTAATFNGMSGSCGGLGGHDAAYLFTAETAGVYSFDTFGSDFDAIVYVLDGTCGGNELACGTDGLLVPLPAGQEVTVVVDSTFASGDYTLNIASLGGNCPDSDLGNTVPQSIAGNTQDSDNSDFGSCGGDFSPDDLYTFTAPSDGLYVFDTLGSALDTVVYLRDGGCFGPELECNDDASAGTPQSIVSHGMVAGQQVIVGVDGNGSGSYVLNVDQVPCPDGSLGVNFPFTVAGTTLNGVNKTQGSCSVVSDAPDYSYSFTAPTDGEYTFDTAGSGFDTVLYVLDGASCNGAQLACSDNFSFLSTSALSVPLTAGQTVSVVVDGANGAEGPFMLNVDQLGGGACPDQDLGNLTPQSESGNNTGGDNTVAGTCGGFTQPDTTYLFTAAADGLYSFDTLGSDHDTVLFVRDGGCGGQEIACNDNFPGFTQSRVLVSLAADQTVMVGVDGGTATGNFDLNVNYSACPDEDLGSDLPATTSGTTVGGFDKLDTPICFDEGAPDYAVQWTAPADGLYTFDTCGSGYDTMLYVQDGPCGSPELACNDDFCGLQSSISLDLTEGQMITIVVSGFAGSSGNFTLNIN